MKRNRAKPIWAIFVFYLLGIAMRQHNTLEIQYTISNFLSEPFQYLGLVLLHLILFSDVLANLVTTS